EWKSSETGRAPLENGVIYFERGWVMKIFIACASLALAGCSAKGPSSFDDLPDGGSGKPDSATGSEAGNDDSGIEQDTGVDTGPPPCVYPAGPYGYTGMANSWQGATIPPTFQWSGYLKGSSQIQTLTANDLFDCDGRNGINALLFDMSALWC